jgi:hypothetical protein
VTLARAAVVLALALLSCRGAARTDDFFGVRLGMAPREVRDRFDLGAQGTFVLTEGADPRLDWTPTASARPVSTARFEFHAGMLVAIRARVDPAAPPAEGPRISITPQIVSARDPGTGGVAITVLSRECPVHKAEAERIAGSAPP